MLCIWMTFSFYSYDVHLIMVSLPERPELGTRKTAEQHKPQLIW